MPHQNDIDLDAHQKRIDEKEAAFVAALMPTHVDTDLKAGDVVTFTNEFGVVFEDKIITGFHHSAMGEQLTNRVVYLAKEAWWFPVPIDSLVKQIAGN